MSVVDWEDEPRDGPSRPVRTQTDMKKRSVTLTTYPCGAVVLEVITETVPDVAPAQPQRLVAASA